MDKVHIIFSLNACTDIRRIILLQYMPFAISEVCRQVGMLTDAIFVIYNRNGCKKSDYKSYIAHLRTYSDHFHVLRAIFRYIYSTGLIAGLAHNGMQLIIYVRRYSRRDPSSLRGYFEFVGMRLDSFRIRRNG